MAKDGVIIGTVTAYYPSHIEAMAARQRLMHLLESSDIAPAGIAPQSILIVRSVSAPGPLSITTWHTAPHWERGVRDVIADYRRRATKPDRGRIPFHAEAILFADEAEMLACLALDLLHGEAWNRWWWRTILGSIRAMPISSGLASLFCHQARAMPAILNHMATWGHAEEIMQALAPRQAQEVLCAVCTAYGLAFRSVQGATPPVGVPGDGGLRTPSGERTRAGRVKNQRAASPGQSPPWELWIPHEAVPVWMSRERSCLLGVALALQRAPSAVRSQEFAAALTEWWNARAEQNPTDERRSTPIAVNAKAKPFDLAADSSTKAQDLSQNPASPSREGTVLPTAETAQIGSSSEATIASSAAYSTEASAAGLSEPTMRLKREAPPRDPAINAHIPLSGTATPVPATVAPEHINPAQVDRTTPRITIPDSAAQPSGEAAATVSSSTSDPTPRTGPGRDAASGRTGTVRAADAQVTGLTVAALADGIITRLAGVLYLINLMRHFELPASFEAEWQLEGRVGTWGVLEALARGLLAAAPSPQETDPIWEALAILNGRNPDTPLGAGLTGSTYFHLPSAWLERAVVLRNSSTVHWAAGRRTLRLWTDSGCLLVETPRNAQSEEIQARTELAAYPTLAAHVELVHSPLHAAPIRPPRMPLMRGVAPALARWLGRALPLLKQRLLQALADANEKQDPISTLLLAPGRLYMTATHVDLVMPLDAISVSARRAGLDRDPGWMPEFGRVILFHYQ